MAYGWNKGVRLALQHMKTRPENLLVVRYEDFVQEPRREMKDICVSCGLPFQEEYLGIPHVNRSESPYNQSSVEKGISSSRLDYYRTVLGDTESGAVRAMVDDRLVRALYPEVLDDTTASVAARAYAGGLVASGTLFVARDHVETLLQDPQHTIQRVRKRLLA